MSTDQLEFSSPLEIYCVLNLDPADLRKAIAGVGDQLLVELYVSEYDPKTGHVVLDSYEKLTAVVYEEVIENLKARKSYVITVCKLPARVHQAARERFVL